MDLIDGQLHVSASDIINFLECGHLTHLDIEAANGRLGAEPKRADTADLLSRKGNEHEAALLESIRAERPVAVIDTSLPVAEAQAATLTAMHAGEAVIHQAALGNGVWRGYADFLERAERPSPGLGGFGYEPADAKLARHVKPYYVLQLCLYAELVELVQEAAPEHAYVLLGSGERVAAARRVLRLFPPDSGPLPRAAGAGPRGHLSAARRALRPLPLVARLRGALDRGRPPEPRRGHASRPARAARARRRGDGRATSGGDGRPDARPHGCWSLRSASPASAAPETGGGLRRAPPGAAPTRGGTRIRAAASALRGRRLLRHRGRPLLRGRTRIPLGGRLLGGRRGALPRLLGERPRRGEARLRGLHRLRARASGALPRHARLPLRPVRADGAEAADGPARHARGRGRRASARARARGPLPRRPPGAADLAPLLLAEARRALLPAGASNLGRRRRGLNPQVRGVAREPGPFAARLDRDLQPRRLHLDASPARLAARTTRRGHRDLRRRDPLQGPGRDRDASRPADRGRGGRSARERALGRTPGEPGGAPGAGQAALAGGPPPELPPPRGQARLLAALRARGDVGGGADGLDTEAIGGLTPEGDLAKLPSPSQSYAQRLRFPPQEHKIGPGEYLDPLSASPDPDTGQPDPFTCAAHEVISVDDASGTLQLKVGPSKVGEPLPRTLIPGKPYWTTGQRAALRELARGVIDHGVQGDGVHRAAREILARDLPRSAAIGWGGPLQEGPHELGRTLAIARGLRESHLFIQGPPGSGKTYTGAQLVIDLLGQGKGVGVTAPSHKSICNLLCEVEKHAPADPPWGGLKKGEGEDCFVSDRGVPLIRNSNTQSDFLGATAPQLLAGTAWLWSRRDMRSSVDYLVIDEAGQVSLADALAMATAAKNLILLGDPLQLAHVSQAVHPEGSGCSVLEHLLGEHGTVPPERGAFLDRSRRMHPEVCDFVSEAVYEGRLSSIEECAGQHIDAPGELSGTGVRRFLVEHEGNTRQSPEEAELIAELVEKLRHGTFTNAEGETRQLRYADMMVVAPYNAQVRSLSERLPQGVQIGTVDKFQGQEAPVVFFSMATSSGEEVPRNVEFLYSRNRLNVAVSRAKSLAVLVCNSKLLTIRCRTVEQMRLVNALCLLVELADDHAKWQSLRTAR